jgi:hypothetical protein
MSAWDTPPGPQGPIGPQGIQGPQGPTGPAGGLMIAHSEATVTVNNNAAETALANITIPANTLKAGDALRFRFYGSILQNSGGGTPNFNWRFAFGSSLSIGPGSVGNVATATSHDRPWIAEFVVQAESIAAQRAHGIVDQVVAAAATGLGICNSLVGTKYGGAENLTAAVIASFYVQMTLASTLVETQLYGYTVEKLPS